MIIVLAMSTLIYLLITPVFGQVGQNIYSGNGLIFSESGLTLFIQIIVIILAGLGALSIIAYWTFIRYYCRYIEDIGHYIDLAVISGRNEYSVSEKVPANFSHLTSSVRSVMSSLEAKSTDIIRTEHARKSVEIRWEILFYSALEAILIGDDEGVLICNPRFEEILKIKSQDLVGVAIQNLPIHSVVGDGSQSLVEIWNRSHTEGERFLWTIQPCKDGLPTVTPVVLDVNLRFVMMNGKILRFLICRNISEEMRLHGEQELAIRQIDKNLGQLAALNDEIRNPLTLIAGWSDLDDHPNREKIMEGVRQINAIVDRIDSGYEESEKVRRYLQKNIDGYMKNSMLK
ncbi:MAG: hypothetical protein LUQ50_15405 [Methanospirillum sp.]|uniref:hypothetical protein n=1 Tax=Methanospirillum sp. TaxID=45200 RepID=UPI00236A36F0|nr:hypothetical protein [Methanospirillum sp.]MDD1730440.1 hypothetical protein [Methanospirillum sp.]